MPTLTINGQEVTVDRGTTVLKAAEQLGIQIPTFCYHPGLSIPANCRMCLVEVEGRDPNRPPPKPIPACHTQVGDGMVINTDNDRVKDIRKAVLEFILINHPVDCPICDQAGECVLQDHYFRYSAKPSRLFTKKVHKPKVKELGPRVMLDAERCIVCTRCVRFCDEVAKSSQLEVNNRGEHSEITTYPGKQLDNPYSENTVDICPVGALTSRDFRFRTRVWFLQSAESVCTECSRGCKIRVDTFENSPRRFKPLENPDVNGWWMCDHGRHSFRQYLGTRMEAPLVRSGGKVSAKTTMDAIAAAAELVQKCADKSRVGVVLSPWFTNEDAFLVGQLMTGALKDAQLFLGGRPDGDQDDILIRADKNPNRKGVNTVFDGLGMSYRPLSDLDGSALDLAIVFGDKHDLGEDGLGSLAQVGQKIVMGLMKTPLWEAADVYLPIRTPWEKDGSYTNFEGVVQKTNRATKPSSTCKSEGYYAMKLAQALGQPLVYSSPDAVLEALATSVSAFTGVTRAAMSPHGIRVGGSDQAGA
jgi:NADH-quinone oxidoreductase subunit G